MLVLVQLVAVTQLEAGAEEPDQTTRQGMGGWKVIRRWVGVAPGLF